MALIDRAVVTAAQGFVFTNTIGSVAPTPAELDALNPALFGALVKTLKSTGTPTSYTLTVGAATTAAIAAAAGPAVVEAALGALSTVGADNVSVSGISVLDTDGLSVAFIGALQGKTVTITGTGTGGTSPTIVVTTATALNGWKNVGHTSRDDMPEFAFDGGDISIKGTWQKKRLREIQTGDPVADSVAIKLEQWDADSLELYFGVDSAATPGVFGVSGDFVPVEKALLIVIVDGDVKVGFHASKASIKRDDSINLPVDDLASLPIKATFLNMGTRRLYDWISLDLLS